MRTAMTRTAPPMISGPPPKKIPTGPMERATATPTRKRMAPNVPMTTRTMIDPVVTLLLRPRLRRVLVRDDDDGRAVSDDLGHRVRHLRAVEAERDDRVGAHHRCVLDHPVDRLAARVLEQARVFVDLAAADRAQAGHDVAADAAAADDKAEDMALGFLDAPAGDERCGRDEHRINLA